MSGNTLNLSDKARALCALDEEMTKLQHEIDAVDETIEFMRKKRDDLAKHYAVFKRISDQIIGV